MQKPQASDPACPFLSIEAMSEVFAAGGEFSDSVIAYEGEFLGAKEYVSFDRRAVDTLGSRGQAVRPL